MRHAVNRVLNSEFEILEAEDGEAGWERLLRDANVQVVISDVQMPRLDGYSMICRIRAADVTRIASVPIIVMTGADDDITRERAYACGANDFITKPIDSMQLLNCVRNHAQTDGPGMDAAALSLILGTESDVDPLTHLKSRRHLLDHSDAIVSQARAKGAVLSVVQLSLDGFAMLRTQYGDDVADQVLIWLGRLLQSKTRKDDTVARIGNAEFTLVSFSSGRVEAAVLAERLRAEISAKPFAIGGKGIPITASIGLVTLGHDPCRTLEEMLALAHRRLKIASAAGGDRLCVSNEKEESTAVEETIIEQPGLDAALAMLERKEYGQLQPYASHLALSTLPLLEFCNRKFGLDLDVEIETLRERLANL
jgi:diguanylate cyclase (GGDEF)-like protein